MVVKNYQLKIRRWPETLWEILLPFFGCFFAGIIAIDMKTYFDSDKQQYVFTPVQLFGSISCIYLIAAFFMTVSFFGTIHFVIHQIAFERFTLIKESLNIMSMQRKAYSISYIIG